MPTETLDAELEQFIQKKFDDESDVLTDGESEGHEVIYHVIFQECMRECAAFASKRARKKAIEECVQVAQDCVDACGKRRKDWSIPMSFTLEQLEKLKS